MHFEHHKTLADYKKVLTIENFTVVVYQHNEKFH